MSSLFRTASLVKSCSLLRLKNQLCIAATRNHWGHHYKPGPYPETTAERAAAAKKYGMTIEEYQPFPEDMGYGDYPKLPDIGGDSKDPYYQYDQPEGKRNFNEPVHIWAHLISEDRYDISMRPRFPVWRQCLWFFGVIFGFGTVYLILEDYKMGRPVVAKQFPQDGPHYSFAPK